VPAAPGSGLAGDAAVCSVQNGVGNGEIAARYVLRVIRNTTIVAGRPSAIPVRPGVLAPRGLP
jgi:hypothetical protein